MAFMLLLSSTGLSLDLHYCQGDLKSFSFFGTAESCHAKAEKSHCSKKKMACHSTNSGEEKTSDLPNKCCSNKSIVVSPDTDAQKVVAEQLTETQITFISAFVAVFFTDQHLDLAKLIIPHLNYIPPLLDQDIPVLIQSFLL